MSKRKANIIECDNPDCLTQHIESEVDPIPGYSFDGGGMRARAYVGSYHHGGGGQGIPAFYACQTECILPALEARLREDWEK